MTMTRPVTVSAACVVSGGQVLRPGWFTIVDGHIGDVGTGSPPTPADHDYPRHTVVPGFVDMHVHGGGGASFTDGPQQVVDFHRARGTTTLVASLVSAPIPTLLDQIRELRTHAVDGTVAGIHLEGPWLAAERCGAHDPDVLVAPSASTVDDLLAAGGGAIRMVTLAPELDGALAAIARLVAAGVVVGVGHTDATYEQTAAAIEAGATVATHLFNAMPSLHHREPGPVLALLDDARVTVELIADGVHVRPEMVAHVVRVVGAERVALVTDAMSAAGMADGDYRLGPVDVEVSGGVARVQGSDVIAGSTATPAGVFRRAAGGFGCGGATDTSLVAAVEMCARTPARALGINGVGDLLPGYRADCVVLDEDMVVRRVVCGGV
ncbi:N-acetylglucosamine-6-phosphate deacetylase [Gordonia sp. NB41Y]|uniref:N-acetylglucosamine-6-phosphate deacetylase n=1 Tax=Gordonia sp. NB41Y TaxID=875808 RepID=UPI0006C130D4|nr:N-acetylglucosamine-6-phosphate deacetylase [Gordonia sp. NB41Y]EMP11461.2 N-acetylglucosamine-6-phosphate deacetylase [Gordonia sp. NB41Y]WLP92846.1 N-acetylglucosamine-6-phosphate deacetylase [Gordonia sp. NB41Y]